MRSNSPTKRTAAAPISASASGAEYNVREILIELSPIFIKQVLKRFTACLAAEIDAVRLQERNLRIVSQHVG